ncbi:protein kinase [Sorangium sp. So ce134]
MSGLPQYTATDEIHSSAEAVIYRGYRNVDRASVAIKLFRSATPTSRQIARLRHEYAITRDLDLSGVVKAYGLERVGGSLALVTESIEEQPLSDLLRARSLSLITSLQIADSIADALDAIHRRHIIHKDIQPQNILVHADTLQVKLIDFGIATRLSQEVQRAASPDALEGTLAYMSPEQTGRMNRALDHRTDLYSLGVTLYEMLTGELPFAAAEPLELLQSHIARQPTPPHERSPGVPEAVSSLVMKLLSKAAEDRYQSAHGLRADLRECLVNVVLTRARTPLDRAHVHARRLLLFNAVAKFDESVRCARTALALLGVELPEGEERIQAALEAELAEVPRNLAGRQIDDLFDAPELESPEHKAALTILTNVSAAMLSASPSLHALACVKHANISLKHGHSEVSAWGYLIYAIVLIGLGRYAEAYEFGRLAMDLDEKMGSAVVSSKVKSSFAIFISPYREPLRRSFAYLAQAHRDGREAGDIQFASYSLLHGITNRLTHGVELAAVSEEIERSLPFLQRTSDVMSCLIVTSSKQMIANLRGCTLGHDTLSDGVFDEAEFGATIGAPNHEFMAAFYQLQRAQLAFLYEDHERALALIALAEPLRPYLANMWMSTELPFYASLILLALYPAAAAGEQARAAGEIARHAADVAAWAESCPANFRHKHLLISAERARVSGDDAAATDLYERAIEAARESEFLHHEALANELAARFHRARGRTKIARMYMTDALHGYARWGAEAKVAQLHGKYPELAPRGAAAMESARPARRTASPGPGEDLDVAAIAKGSQALSGERSIEDSRLYGALEEKVRERTAELEEARAKLVRLEREATDKRAAGGLAREVEDALAGAMRALARALGQDESSSRPCLTFDSGVELGKLHEELSLRFSDEEMDRIGGRLQHIFENQEELDAALRLVFKATDHALAVTREIMSLCGVEGGPPLRPVG